MRITEVWKEENLINLSIPLSIEIKFKHRNLQDLDKLKKIFPEINIISSFSLEEFNINNSLFKINYYGNPKRLKTELFGFGYQLRNDKGHWELHMGYNRVEPFAFRVFGPRTCGRPIHQRLHALRPTAVGCAPRDPQLAQHPHPVRESAQVLRRVALGVRKHLG